MIFFRLAGIKRGFGWQPPLTQKNRVQNLKKRKFVRESERLLQMLESNGINAIPEKYPLQLSEDDVSIVNELLKRNGLNGKEKNVGIVLGAKRPQNRWPLAYYNEVIHYLISENYHCLLIGGPGDQLLAQQLSPSKNIHDFTGKLNPVQSSLVFGNCQFAISNDTGPMHLAYAAGTYVFALFSSRDYPIIWYPPEEKSTVFRNNDIDCAVCFSETCSNNICMQAIKPDVVINAIKIYLSNSNNS
jgi:ADP-heptose:LPS heptosyltransferase